GLSRRVSDSCSSISLGRAVPVSFGQVLPAELHLEVRSRLPSSGAPNGPPLLFVHGGFCDSWYWEPYFLAWFAAQGYAAHALSLRGHGRSGGKETLFLTGLDDYAADVERIA